MTFGTSANFQSAIASTVAGDGTVEFMLYNTATSGANFIRFTNERGNNNGLVAAYRPELTINYSRVKSDVISVTASVRASAESVTRTTTAQRSGAPFYQRCRRTPFTCRLPKCVLPAMNHAAAP